MIAGFEKALSDACAEMIAAALEFAPSVEKVFIYASDENNTIQPDVFYLQNGKLLYKDRVSAPDTSRSMKSQLLKYISSQVALVRSAADSDHPAPTEYKLRYDVASRQLDVGLQYGQQLSGPDDSQEDHADAWFDELQSRNA